MAAPSQKNNFGVHGEALRSAWPYFLVTGLLYPGVVGAMLTWLAQGVGARFLMLLGESPSPVIAPPSWRAILIVLWFAIYHGSWFLRLLEKFSAWSSNPSLRPLSSAAYTGHALFSDLIDGVAMLMVVGTLSRSLAPENAELHLQFVFLFVAVGLLAISVFVAYDMEMMGERMLLTFVAFVVGFAGAITNFAGIATWILNTVFFGVLYVLLGRYLFFVSGRS